MWWTREISRIVKIKYLVELYSLKNLNANSNVLPPNCVVGQSNLIHLFTYYLASTNRCHDIMKSVQKLFVICCRPAWSIDKYVCTVNKKSQSGIAPGEFCLRLSTIYHNITTIHWRNRHFFLFLMDKY